LCYHEELKVSSFYKTYEIIVKKVENKTVYYEETVECRHLIFWPENQRRIHCHTAKPEPNWKVTVDQVPLLEKYGATTNHT
jgi:hypothetical protein